MASARKRYTFRRTIPQITQAPAPVDPPADGASTGDCSTLSPRRSHGPRRSARAPGARCALAALLPLAATPAHALRDSRLQHPQLPGHDRARARIRTSRPSSVRSSPTLIVAEEIVEPGGRRPVPRQRAQRDRAGPVGVGAVRGRQRHRRRAVLQAGQVVVRSASGASIPTREPAAADPRLSLRPVGYTSRRRRDPPLPLHLKASTRIRQRGPAPRRGTRLRDSMNAHAAGHARLRRSATSTSTRGNEPGYGKLIEVQARQRRPALRPAGRPGHRAGRTTRPMTIYHTQSPCLSGGASVRERRGDRRARRSLRPDPADAQLERRPGLRAGPGHATSPVGNDGQHLNNNITDAPTIPEGAAYATALIKCERSPAAAGRHPAAGDGRRSPSSLDSRHGDRRRHRQPRRSSNAGARPRRRPHLHARRAGGFSAPAGTFEVWPARRHRRTRHDRDDVGPFGPRAGDLTARARDDLDHPSRVVALHGERAGPRARLARLDWSSRRPATIDFGTHAAGRRSRPAGRVHNHGYDAPQAQLVHHRRVDITAATGASRSSASPTPDAGRGRRTALRARASTTPAPRPIRPTRRRSRSTARTSRCRARRRSRDLIVTLTATVQRAGRRGARPARARRRRTRLYAPAPNPLSRGEPRSASTWRDARATCGSTCSTSPAVASRRWRTVVRRRAATVTAGTATRRRRRHGPAGPLLRAPERPRGSRTQTVRLAVVR